MCGIAGFFRMSSRERDPEDELRLWAQIATFWYRGPDAQRVVVGPGIGLGHTRLPIIDLSADALQPMATASGRTTVVLNGEIYNFVELRRELEAAGLRFRTRSDTEVVAEGYEAWGLDVVHRLRGMFAIAVWDAPADRLVLFRDRVGKKPLYHAIHDGAFLFASEIKGIVRWPGVPREPDLAALDEYLTYQYVPAPRTAFRGISKLPPAHLMVVERGRPSRTERYFRLPEPARARPRPEEELCAELLERLREATRLRLVADVPVGAFLSGGVDSSAVVAMMAQLSGAPVRTFTAGFGDPTHDERRFARQVAERYGTRHEEFVVRPDGAAILEDLVYHYGEPFADSSALPTYLLARFARAHVTVALSGDGGDESFLGYRRYVECRQREADGPEERPSRSYGEAIAYFSDAAKGALYGERMRGFLATSALARLDPFFDEAPTAMAGAGWAELHTYLPDDLLVKMDVASMAHSLEVRSPFLDHPLMEWAAAIPDAQKVPGADAKALLKRAMAPYLPAEVLYRPKMGFSVPIAAWLRGDMRDFTRALLLSGPAAGRGLFDLAALERLLDREPPPSVGQASPAERQAWRVWALLMLELWFRMWIDSDDAFRHPTAARIMSRGFRK